MQLPCPCCKDTSHQDDYVINNAWGLFSATDHDVIGAAPFSVSTLAFTAFFLVPSVLPSLIFCVFSVAFVVAKGPLFLWWAVLSGEVGARRAVGCAGGRLSWKVPQRPHLPGWQQ